MDPHSMTVTLIKRGKWGHRYTGEKVMWRLRQRSQWCTYKPRNTKDGWQLSPVYGMISVVSQGQIQNIRSSKSIEILWYYMPGTLHTTLFNFLNDPMKWYDQLHFTDEETKPQRNEVIYKNCAANGGNVNSDPGLSEQIIWFLLNNTL